MKEIIKLIVKYHYTLVFIILELVSFALIVQHNEYQRVIFSRFTSSFFGSISSFATETRNYFRLNEINRGLAEENVRLRNELGIREDSIPLYHSDTTNNRAMYDYLGSKVNNITYNRMKNYITVKGGSEQGMASEMAVISPEGVVGIIQDVSDHYSIVIPLINIDSRISARVKKNNYYGSVQWDGNDYRYSYLKDIPSHASVTAGDTIITSGFSSIFPEGILIGIVDEVEKENANFLNIRLRLAVDFKSISELYVLRNNRKNEQKELEEGFYNE